MKFQIAKRILFASALSAVAASFAVVNIFAQEATQSANFDVQFPNCEVQSGVGDKSNYDSGNHWIVGGGLLSGKDDVYTQGGENYLQCYCPFEEEHIDGDEGIQTNWISAHTTVRPQDINGFFTAWGPDFGLDASWYFASGADKPSPTTANFDCNPPTESLSPSPSPTPTTGDGGNSGSGGSTNSGQVAGAATQVPQVLASTGNLPAMIAAIGFSMLTLGLWQAVKRS